MTRKTWIISALVVLLGGTSLYLNWDRFRKDALEVFHRSRPVRMVQGPARRFYEKSESDPVLFGFNRMLKFKELRVVPVSAIATNKYPHPIWHLVTKSNSVPMNEFFYGSPIRGMYPNVKGAIADQLVPGDEYRLYYDAIGYKGYHDFVPEPRRQ